MPFHYIVPSPSTALVDSIQLQYRHSTYTCVNWVCSVEMDLAFLRFLRTGETVGARGLLIAHPPPIVGDPDIRKIFL